MTDQDRQPNVISALKRLERLGSDSSQQAQKLIDAAVVAAEAIAACIPPEHRRRELPRGYRAMPDGIRIPAREPGISTANRATVTRADALYFAEDIANGWLDELAEWLAAQAIGDAKATERLTRAAQEVRR